MSPEFFADRREIRLIIDRVSADVLQSKALRQRVVGCGLDRASQCWRPRLRGSVLELLELKTLGDEAQATEGICG